MMRQQAAPTCPEERDAGDWLIGGGELGRLIRSTDWSTTSLGPRERWPHSLRTAINLIVGCKFPMALLWGQNLLLLYNDAFRELAADRHPYALGRALARVWPERWQLCQPSLAAVMERGETVWRHDQLFPVRRGAHLEEAYFSLCYSPVHVEDATVGATLLSAQETTCQLKRRKLLAKEAERKLSEATLRRREAQFKALIENIHSGVALIDGSGRFTLYNRQFLAMFGLAPDSDIKNVNDQDWSAWQVFDEHGVLLAVDEHPVRKAARTGRPVRNQLVGVRLPASPGLVWMQVSAAPLLDAEGNLEHLICTYHDVSERRAAEQAIRARENDLARAQAAAHLGSWRWDLVKDVVTWSEELFRLTGVEPTSFVPSRAAVEQLIHPEDRARLAEAVALAMAGKAVKPFESRVTPPDGEERVTQAGGFEVELDASGQPAVLYGTILDITELKRTEEALRLANLQLREADRRKNEFLSVLSHELRNPLAPIHNGLHLLNRVPPGGPQARRAVETVERQVQLLTRLVDDLLDVTRISRGKIRLNLDRVELGELVRRTAEDHRALFASARLELQVRTGGALLHVNGDATRLAQAIGNLLANAIKFTPPGGQVVLSLTAEDGLAVIRVKDSGEGIEPRLLGTLFEPFVQADRTLDRSKGGLGLGLALVKGVLEMHGGDASARSNGVGHGAEFTLRVPLESAVAPQPGAVPAPIEATPPRRVLIVEDNIDTAESLKDLLALSGHQVIAAYSGPDGLEAARSFQPEIVLCDIGLPGLDGYGVARALRADPDLKSATLIALSGYALQEDVEKSREAGFDRHLAKPPNLEALEKLLRDG